jgi:hypothetical protein
MITKKSTNEEIISYIDSLENLSMKNDYSIKKINLGPYSFYIFYGEGFSKPYQNCKTIEVYILVRLAILRNMERVEYKLTSLARQTFTEYNHWNFWASDTEHTVEVEIRNLFQMLRDMETLLLVGAFV